MSLVAITSLLLHGFPFDCDNLLRLVFAVQLFAHMHGVCHPPVWSTLLRILLLGLATMAAFIVPLTSMTVLALRPGAKS